MEFYNTENIVRIVVTDAQQSSNWYYLPVKSLNTRVDFIINHEMWKANRNKPLYQYAKYPEWYTVEEISEKINETEYIDEETKQIMEYPKVTLYLSDGSNTEIHFTAYSSAEQYAKALIGKSSTFIQLDKIN